MTRHIQLTPEKFTVERTKHHLISINSSAIADGVYRMLFFPLGEAV
ncbi:hypothetical protein [Alkalibacterium olivapovliticus]|nr:hypothetical protein [Alkalibacterium olivapovliticus]